MHLKEIRTFFIYLIQNRTDKLNLHIIYLVSFCVLFSFQSDSIILCHSQAALNVAIKSYLVLCWTLFRFSVPFFPDLQFVFPIF